MLCTNYNKCIYSNLFATDIYPISVIDMIITVYYKIITIINI